MKFKTFCAAVMACALLSACGIKPADVDPPKNAKGGYPHVYPNPKYDPEPVRP